MTVFDFRIAAAPDGTVSGRAPADVPPGEHPVPISVWKTEPQSLRRALPRHGMTL